MKTKKISYTLLVISLVALLFGSAYTSEPSEQYDSADNVCTGYDVKIDEPGTYEGPEATLVVTKEKSTWTAKLGYEIVGACVKIGGPGGGTLISFDDGDGSYTTDSYDISHTAISFKKIETPEPPEPPVQPFVRITYICQAPEDGIVEGYNIPMLANQHLWRIRHEQGSATDFHTNFLSDVQGHVEIGQTLFFATYQGENGVKAITTPLENLYGGTASISGAVCDLQDDSTPIPTEPTPVPIDQPQDPAVDKPAGALGPSIVGNLSWAIPALLFPTGGISFFLLRKKKK